ncbi:hypothetical protein AVI51_16300 (plasmid) [Piscirickettsia salmonis]|nr:hypothetical protein AVI51_16300 [Piscirickettsia salmonis]
MPKFQFLAQSNQTDVMIYHSIESGDAAYFIDKIKTIPKIIRSIFVSTPQAAVSPKVLRY